jgi:hypothetical protein
MSAFSQHGKILIDTLRPNEAKYLMKKLNNIGLNVTYSYIKGIYYQYIVINNTYSGLLTIVKRILKKENF